MLSNERLQLAHERGVAAVGEVGFDSVLEARQPQVLEPFDLVSCEPLVCEIGQRRSSPERERLAELALIEKALKAGRIELIRLDPKPVARRLRGDPLLAEHLA